jgi:hypothetical protein
VIVDTTVQGKANASSVKALLGKPYDGHLALHDHSQDLDAIGVSLKHILRDAATGATTHRKSIRPKAQDGRRNQSAERRLSRSWRPCQIRPRHGLQLSRRQTDELSTPSSPPAPRMAGAFVVHDFAHPRRNNQSRAAAVAA